MLLRHTDADVKDRHALTINPAKTCQPVGAMYAALGIHGCLPHSHGSQGCCSYHRSTLTRHYKEPVMAGTSSFTEGSSVFGGQANLLTAIGNMFELYKPEVVAIHTTCLSETIGDDINQIATKAKEDGLVPDGKFVIHCNTPSYVGSHVTGFSNMVKGFVKYFPKNTGVKKDVVNIFPGWVEPSDMREIKRMAAEFGVKIIITPDTSDVLDAPLTGKYEMYPKGGTTVAELIAMGDSKFTIALGKFASEDAAIDLENKCKVKFATEDLPIGIRATDRFLTKFSSVGSKKVPQILTDERGRLVDAISDMQQYLYGKRVALWGDPDQLIPLTEFLVDLGMKPVYIVSGTPGKYFDVRMNEILSVKVPEAKYKNGEQADMYLMHQWIKEQGVDLLIGNTYGKYIARDEEIPFIRLGFPIMDRIGHSYFPLVGYAGGLRLVEKILSSLMDYQDKTSPEESFELVM